jgi:hypothetical protein
MPSNPSRSELVAELTELRRLQLTSLADATYIGWTQEQQVAHQKRSNRISAVQRELNGLDGTSGWEHSFWLESARS